MLPHRHERAMRFRWVLQRIQKKAIHTLYSKLYQDSNRDLGKSAVIVGVGRSGTTWLANLIASQSRCRIMWEPFNPHAVEVFSQFNDFHYMSPIERAPDLYRYAHAVLRGEIKHKWIDREITHISFDCRIIKEIRANFFLKWLHARFPAVPFILIVRHPCAVVLSRMEANWPASADLNAILSQAELVDEFLSDKLNIINNARTAEAQHALLWAIQHLVPIRQFCDGELPVVFYEDLCLQPEVEIPRVFQIIGHSFRNSVFKHVAMPSRTATQTSAIMTGENRVSRWKNVLSRSQIREILTVVRGFGLDYLYDDSSTPLVKELCQG